MTQPGTWVSLSGTEPLERAIVLLVIAGVMAFLATRLRHPVAAARPGRAVAAFMILTWLLSMATFLIGVGVDAIQLKQDNLVSPLPANPIGYVTYPSVVVTFLVIAYLGRRRGPRVALGSALVGALAAPMIFELPFDLVIMGRTYPPIPPNPTLYRDIFFFPLYLVEVTTLSLLTFSPMVRLTRWTLLALASMFVVFAVWAVFGFSYPSEPLPIALNVVSKILAFVATITLFVRRDVAPDGP